TLLLASAGAVMDHPDPAGTGLGQGVTTVTESPPGGVTTCTGSAFGVVMVVVVGPGVQAAIARIAATASMGLTRNISGLLRSGDAAGRRLFQNAAPPGFRSR